MPAKAVPSSLTVVCSACWSTDSTVVEMSPSSFWVGIGVRVSAVAICESSLRYGLSSDCGWSSTYCSPTAERLPTRASASAGMSSYVVVDVEVHVDAGVGELELLDLTDPHAAVAHLAAGEDAAGVLEVGDDGVRRVDEHAVEPRVARPDEADPDQGDQHEDDELDAGAAGDHGATTIPGTSRLTRAGS